MKIKRFMDSDMRHVLRRVREEQGPDAVILSNRRVDGGIEVISAIDYDEALVQQALGSQPGSAADYGRLAEAFPDSDDRAAVSSPDIDIVSADLHPVTEHSEEANAADI